MAVRVINCFNWIGYHLVQRFLKNGHKVMGFDDLRTDKQVHLSMFVGRNANFEWIDSSDEAQKQPNLITVEVNPTMRHERIRNGFIYLIRPQHGKTTCLTIELPLLFGPWMPMTDSGMYRVNGEWIWFDSKTFVQEAFCIEKYMELLVHWLETNQLYTQYDPLTRKGGTIAGSDLHAIENDTSQDLKHIQSHFLNNRSFY